MVIGMRNICNILNLVMKYGMLVTLGRWKWHRSLRPIGLSGLFMEILTDKI